MKMRILASTIALSVLLAACSGAEPDADTPSGDTAAEAGAKPAAKSAAELGPLDTKDGISYASLTGDAATGARVFAQCRSCHVTDPGVHRTGPSLAGIVGAPAGAVDGYKYTEANASSGLTWSEEQLYAYLENPRRTIPGTKMAFPGLRDAQQRADLIAYLKDPS